MNQNRQIQLSGEMVEAFSGAYLSPRYDQPQPTPACHREWWDYYCSPRACCAIAAPRSHAKSTALTHDYGLANLCFRTQDYVLLLGASEEMAIGHLADMAAELRENDNLRRDFHIKDFVQDQKTDIIVVCTDGHMFRVLARGVEQKIRGLKWRGKRPGMVLGDDIEEDEQVENKERREKLSRWFFRAVKPALRNGGLVRIHGTILHEDSLLANLISLWEGKLYKAHRSFDEFLDILWPEQFPEGRLRAIRDEFIKKLDSAGYSQEYLNDPFDNSDPYIRKEDLIEMSEEDYAKPKVYCAAADFAVSTEDKANRSSITVGGKDLDNFIHYVDQRVGRWDSLELVDELFFVYDAWHPQIFWVEDGQIWQAIWPMIRSEMLKRDVYINFKPIRSTKDKAARGRSLQKRTRARAARFDKKASWWAPFENEILRFTGITEAKLDDQFDSAALVSRGFEEFYDLDEEDVQDERLLELQAQAIQAMGTPGRSRHTGY